MPVGMPVKKSLITMSKTAPAPAQPAAFCPALLVAAPASGQGKTTVVSALARLHARQGRRVRVFKCGPDFLDPGWHQLACGHAVHNLDMWMCGEQDVRQRLHQAAQTADLIVIEGVMGLFDGQPSAADLAMLLGVPVMAVIDAGKMAETFGAVVHGLQHWRAGLRWAGVLANRVGSPRHAHMLAQSVAQTVSGHFLGAVQRSSGLALPERHLGLTAAQEMADALQRLDAAADALAQTPLGQMDAAALQQWRTPFAAPPAAPAIPKLLAGKTIAVANDAAFQFIYPANIDTLKQLGARIAYFSPLLDAALPACDALWLPGGYPELHVAKLAANQRMAASVRAHVQAGKPVWAEGGGMVALFNALQTADHTSYPLWGILPGVVQMQDRLAGLGLQQLALPGAEPLRGHTFHFSACRTEMAVAARTSRPGQAAQAGQGEALYRQGSVAASYFYPWFASSPAATASLFGA